MRQPLLIALYSLVCEFPAEFLLLLPAGTMFYKIGQTHRKSREVILMKGSKLLRVSSILMTISGALCLFSSFLMIVTGSVIFGLMGIASIGAVITTLVIIDTVVIGILELSAGVFGVKNWNQPTQAKKGIVIAIVVLVLSFFVNTLTLRYEGDILVVVVSVILSLIVPALYLIGVVQLNKIN